MAGKGEDKNPGKVLCSQEEDRAYPIHFLLLVVVFSFYPFDVVCNCC